jgi:hypothetical protein
VGGEYGEMRYLLSVAHRPAAWFGTSVWCKVSNVRRETCAYVLVSCSHGRNSNLLPLPFPRCPWLFCLFFCCLFSSAYSCHGLSSKTTVCHACPPEYASARQFRGSNTATRPGSQHQHQRLYCYPDAVQGNKAVYGDIRGVRYTQWNSEC